MLKIPFSYRLPVGVSVFLHVILLIALSINVSTQNRYRFEDQNRPMSVINAVAVDQQFVDNQTKKMQRAEEQKQLVSMRAKQLQLKQEQEREAAARKKALAMKKQKQAALVERQQQLQKKLLQQEMAQEKVQVAKVQQTAQIQGVLNRYKAQIIQAIEQQWIVPTDTDKNLSCILLIRLVPGGNVLSVETVQSSGDAVLDRSARVAVFKASPLPVPKNTAAFSEFRELRLTVRPLQIEQSSPLHEG